MNAWQEISFAFWIFLPAGLANMAPVLAAHLPGLKKFDQPLDGHLMLGRERLLGPHKTIRGLLCGVALAIACVFVQKHFGLAGVDYNSISPWVLGTLFGVGALLGDAVKSFFKRRLAIAPGRPFLFFDQIDYILGGILLTFWYLPLSAAVYAYILLIYFLLHLAVSVLGFLVGLKTAAI